MAEKFLTYLQFGHMSKILQFFFRNPLLSLLFIFRKLGLVESLEINNSLDIQIASETSLICRGVSPSIEQTESDITPSTLSIHHYSAFLSPMSGMIRRILITACSTRFVKVYCSDGVGLAR